MMMRTSTILAILAIGLGLFVGTLMWVLLVAGAANASGRLMAAITRVNIALLASMALALVGGGVCAYLGRGIPAIVLGLLPIVVGVVGLVIVDRVSR